MSTPIQSELPPIPDKFDFRYFLENFVKKYSEDHPEVSLVAFRELAVEGYKYNTNSQTFVKQKKNP